VARRGAPALHGAQGTQPDGQSAEAPTRSSAGRLSPYRLRRDTGGGAEGTRRVPTEVEKAVPMSGGFSGRSGGRAADVLSVPRKPMGVPADNQRDRADAAGVPPESETQAALPN